LLTLKAPPVEGKRNGRRQRCLNLVERGVQRNVCRIDEKRGGNRLVSISTELELEKG